MSMRARTAWVAAALCLAGCASDAGPRPADVPFTVIEPDPAPAVAPAPAPVADPTPAPVRTARAETPREPAPQPVAVTPASAAPAPAAADTRTAAIDRLVLALDDPDPLLRANAIEALHPVPDYAAVAVRRGLVDPNRGVRFVAVVTVGKLRLDSVVHLVEPLLEDPSGSVRAGAIYALRRNGRRINPTPLAAMLDSPDAEVKANAAVILGELGDASAVPMLEQAMGQGLERSSVARARIVDMQIAEALVKLGSERHIEGIRAALFAPAEQGEITALACHHHRPSARQPGRAANLLSHRAAHRPSPSQAPNGGAPRGHDPCAGR